MLIETINNSFFDADIRVHGPMHGAALPRLFHARPVRLPPGLAVQAVGMGRIDAGDLHLVGEERKVLQGQRRVAVLGVALHVGMEPGGDEIPP